MQRTMSNPGPVRDGKLSHYQFGNYFDKKVTAMFISANGIALNTKHQELMVLIGNGNTIMTFYFPEVF